MEIQRVCYGAGEVAQQLRALGALLEIPSTNCNGDSFVPRGILAVRSQGIPQSHTTQQTSHKRFIGKATRAQVRSSRELTGRKTLYRVSWGWSFPGWRFPEWGLVGFQVRGLDWAQGLVSFHIQGLVGFQTLEVRFDLLSYRYKMKINTFCFVLFCFVLFCFVLFCFVFSRQGFSV